MDFDIAVQVLCDAEVEFVVLGGLSATLHGSATLTFDLDVCYSPTRANLRRLAEALAPFHPRPRGLPDTLDTDIGEIDLLSEVAGVGTFDDVQAASIVVEAYGRRFPILDLRSLIKAKRATGRQKDLNALPELEGLLEAEEP